MEWNQNGITINCTQYGKFIFEHAGDKRQYDTLELAREAADRAIKAEEKTSRIKLDIAATIYQVRDNTVTESVLTGIHAGTGALLLKPGREKYSSASVYLRAPTTELLNRLVALHKEMEIIKEALEPFEIKDAHKPYGHDLDYEQAIADLQTSVTGMRAGLLKGEL